MKKYNLRLKLREYYIYKDLLYINNRLFISNKSELRTRILRIIHETLLEEYVNYFSIYERLSTYYF